MQRLIVFLFFILFSSAAYSQKSLYSKHECNVRNLTFQAIDSVNSLFPYLINEKSSGVVELHPFSMDDIGGWGNFISSLKTDPNITFEYESTRPSRLLGGTYFSYQQYYRGILVEDGGFTIYTETDSILSRPDISWEVEEPCLTISMVAPNIYEDIDITSVLPSITEASFTSIIPGIVDSIKSFELKLVNNIQKNCEYNLVYLVHYNERNEGDMIAWIDAKSGNLLRKFSERVNKNAPTADYGMQPLNDSPIAGGLTQLSNGRLIVYDNSGRIQNGTAVLWHYQPSIHVPTSPSNIDWNETHSDPEVFQLFWMTDQLIDVFSMNLDVNFIDVRAGYNSNYNNAEVLASSRPSSLTQIVFGNNIDGNSYVEYDIIGHELGHAFVNSHFGYTQIENRSLHEGLADIIGTYVESILEPNGIDWVIGDNIPEVLRDLENTPRNCFTSIQNLDEQHDRGEALGHWFFLTIMGDVDNNIPPMDIDEVIELIMEGLIPLKGNPDYPDLMKTTLFLAEKVYGSCSNQFLTILRAWEQICVNTGHRMADPTASCNGIVNGGLTTICEDSNQFKMCLLGSIPNIQAGRWTIIGRNSTSFSSILGMQGNTQVGGNCLDVTQIPSMPFYPQEITISYWHPTLGGEVFLKKILINDCNGNKPTCDEFHEPQGMVFDNDSNALQEVEKDNSLLQLLEQAKSNNLYLIIYDIMGNIVSKGYTEYVTISPERRTQILIFTFWDQNGHLVTTKKSFIGH